MTLGTGKSTLREQLRIAYGPAYSAFEIRSRREEALKYFLQCLDYMIDNQLGSEDFRFHFLKDS